jgi:hypothetical protein
MVWGRGRSHSELDVRSYSGSSDAGQPFSYDDALNKLNSDLSRPHLYEERFSYMRDGAWTMENTRRAIWHYTLAGGMGAWWGFYEFGVAGSPLPPYPNPEQLATVNQFWENRFTLDMEPANHLTDGFALRTSSNTRFVFYKENTSSIQMDLSGMIAPQPAVAVDSLTAYTEIDLGVLSSDNHTWIAPHASDWAIAVGEFDVVMDFLLPDFDDDGDVDLEDFGHFQMCYSGSGEIQADPNCQDAILDNDSDVDANDLAIFLACMSGANVPADETCDNAF